VPYRAARDPEGAKYFSRFAVARSAIGHWLVQLALRGTALYCEAVARSAIGPGHWLVQCFEQTLPAYSR
jgi:hypothetical protein